MPQIIIVTGLSGAGKTQTLKIFSDIGYDIIDNLPIYLLSSVLSQESVAELRRPLAIGLGVTAFGFDTKILNDLFITLKQRGDFQFKTLFLDCDNDVLHRRYRETRFKHPLAPDRPVEDCLIMERGMLQPLRETSDVVIDTSDFSLVDLRHQLHLIKDQATKQKILISLLSFSYKTGLPREADMVFDVRFLRNPFWVDSLKKENGLHPKVQDYIQKDPLFDTFFTKLQDMLLFLLPSYQKEGKNYFTLAIGCTGGQHRSVCTVDLLQDFFTNAGYHTIVRHKNLG